MHMTELNERLRAARKRAGATQQALADHLGIQRVNVTQWEGGTTRPDQSRLPQIASYLGVSLEWLMKGAGPMADDAGLSPAPVSALPLRGEVAAGRWLEVGDMGAFEFEPESVSASPTPGIPANFQFALVVRGSSLNRLAKDGDILVCVDVIKSGIRVDEGDLVVVERKKFQGALREVTAKRLRIRGAGYDLCPESDDPRYQEPIHINSGDHDDEEISVVAKVLWIMKKP
jgi:transcriptional regulator with XRE-family HTH domain